jgi:hypothetical protein
MMEVADSVRGKVVMEGEKWFLDEREVPRLYTKENYLLPATTNVFRASQSMVFAPRPQRRGIGASQQHPFFTPLLIHVTCFLGCYDENGSRNWMLTASEEQPPQARLGRRRTLLSGIPSQHRPIRTDGGECQRHYSTIRSMKGSVRDVPSKLRYFAGYIP